MKGCGRQSLKPEQRIIETVEIIFGAARRKRVKRARYRALSLICVR